MQGGVPARSTRPQGSPSERIENVVIQPRINITANDLNLNSDPDWSKMHSCDCMGFQVNNIKGFFGNVNYKVHIF